MRDGGKPKGKQNNSIVGSGSNHFSRAVSRIAVAQVCQSIGFDGFNESALDSLADVAIRYLYDLGSTSRYYANSASRTRCNLFDVIQGLEDLGMPTGFSGASKVHTDCVLSSGAIREIREYVESAEEVPFAQTVPRFPVIREQRMIPSFLSMGETPSFKYIPAWLPAFPDPHTYVHTPVWNERASDPRTDKIELVRQHRKAERSLLSLQRRLLCNGSSVAAASTEPDDAGNVLEVSKMDNPFLAEPLAIGEGDVSPVNIPAKISVEAHIDKRSSLLETFSPAIEAIKDGLDSGSDCERILPEKRTSVFLEFKGGKRLFGESLDLRIRNKAPEKTGTWFGREGDRDDKKRRVEFIIRQSLENQQELPQL